MNNMKVGVTVFVCQLSLFFCNGLVPYSSTVEPMNSDYEKMVSTLQYEWTECNKKLILLKG